jgi:hypothetical protein
MGNSPNSRAAARTNLAIVSKMRFNMDDPSGVRLIGCAVHGAVNSNYPPYHLMMIIQFAILEETYQFCKANKKNRVIIE